MAEAGKALGAAVGSKTQARRKALQLNETGQAWARGELNSDLKPATGLGPAAGVELKAAQQDLQAQEDLKAQRQREHQFDLPPELYAMREFMHPESWNRVLEERAMRLVQEETAERRDQMTVYQRHKQEAQGCAVDVAEQIKQRAHDLNITGYGEPAPRTGVWLELENLRCQVVKVHQTAELLTDRLSGALKPMGETAVNRTPGPAPDSRLSVEVEQVAVSVGQVLDLLQSTLERLDL